MVERPFVWQMVKEAVIKLGGKASYKEIKNYIANTYENVNENTITAQIIVSTVNHKSRIHYPENNKPRLAESRYDFLYSTGRGEVELYHPEKHGMWEIAEDDMGKLFVRLQSDEITQDEDESEQESFVFPLENHLQAFIVQNIESIKINGKKLMLYVDDSDNDGVEYQTDIGRIDILAVDDQEDFFVFELKVGKGPDSAVGQVLRYMGWVKEKLAQTKNVTGIVVSKKANDKIKYAASMTPDVHLFEYDLAFDIKEVS